ncbi:hypothetical protein PENSPDRAFT_51422 [Peniophora sp. CONT]|nr:hypothetical protein PENSPDRAFT_51422 [Peniophora sp. CONT]
MALFAQTGAGSDIATAVLIENRTPYGGHNVYLPELYHRMRRSNPNARIAIGFFATSPAPPVWPAQGSPMLPDVVVDPSAPPISVGSLLYAALTLAESDCKARHLFVVAHTPPTDDADVHPAANRGIVPQLQELGTMPPPQRWAFLRQKLIQAHTRLHLLIRPEVRAPAIIDLFHGVREAHNDVEVPVWFQVDHANCSLYLSGPSATPGNMPSPPNMLQSPTQDQQSSASIHAAALNPSSLIPHPSQQAIPLASQSSLPPSQNHSPPAMQLQGPPLSMTGSGTISAPPMLPGAAHAHVSALQPAQLAAAYVSVSATRTRSRHNSLTHPPQQPPMLPPSQSPTSQFSNSGLVAAQVVQSMHSPLNGHSPPPAAQRSSPPGVTPSLVSYLQSRHGLSRKRGPAGAPVPFVAENSGGVPTASTMAMGAGARAKAVAKAAPVIGGVGKKPRVVSGGVGRSSSLQMAGMKEEDALASPLVESPVVGKVEDPGNSLFIFPPDEQMRAAHGQIPSFAPPGSGYSPPLPPGQQQMSVSPTAQSFPSPEQRMKTTPERQYAMGPPPVPRRTSPPQAHAQAQQMQMQGQVQTSPEMHFAPPSHPPPARRSPPSETYPPMDQVFQQQQQQDQFFPPQHPPMGYQKYSPSSAQAQAQAQAYAQHQQQPEYPSMAPPPDRAHPSQQQQYAANSPEDFVPANANAQLEETVPASSSGPAPADTPLMGPGQGFASPQDFMNAQAYANVGGFGLNGFASATPPFDSYGVSQPAAPANGFAAPPGPPPPQPSAVLGGFIAPPPPQPMVTQSANGFAGPTARSQPQRSASGYATPPNGYRTPPNGRT